MPNLKYLPPEEKKMFVVIVLGVGAMGLGMAANAVPALGTFLSPLAVICAVGFVAAFVGPAEKLFPLRTLARRASPALAGWIAYIFKALLFFGGMAAALYLLSRLVRSLI